jgi:sugar phosphate isomerase/epimerase
MLDAIEDTSKEMKDQVQVNIPFVMLHDSFFDRFLEERINPEIGLDAEALDSFTLPEFRQAAKRLSDRGLRVTLHAPFVDLSPGSPDPEFWNLTRRRFEQVVKLIPVFRPQTVVCHAGFETKRYGFLGDAWFENSIRMWTWLGRLVHEEGARLMLENVFEDGPDELKILFESLDKKRVAFCLDTGHQSAFSNTPLEIWIGSLGSHIGQLHLHDNFGEKDEHIALGKGIIDFPAFFRALKRELETPPVITLEPHREEELRPSLEYLERVWPWA